MSKYLDETGLARVWAHTKSYVDNKINSPSPVAGDTYLVKAPVGTIVIWSGTVDDIPAGWHLCDGTDGTPDLQDKFVLGAGTAHKVGETGGEEKVALTISQLPYHSHTVSVKGAGNATMGKHITANLSEELYEKSTISTSSAGNDVAHENMPPYYALCYIMKLTADETDGGTSFTTDETLTMSEENVLGVTTPTKGFISQQDFDALPEEEKNRGLYVIPGDGVVSSVGGTYDNVYSMEERRIGTWIDGKPLYRRVYKLTSPENTGNGVTIGRIEDSCEIKKMSGTIFLSNDVIIQLPYIDTDAQITVSFATKGRNILFTNNYSYASGKAVLLFMEYTKSTDLEDGV